MCHGGGFETSDDMYLSLQDGEIPLIWATRSGDVEFVKLLLDQGVEVNVQANIHIHVSE